MLTPADHDERNLNLRAGSWNALGDGGGPSSGAGVPGARRFPSSPMAGPSSLDAVFASERASVDMGMPSVGRLDGTGMGRAEARKVLGDWREDARDEEEDAYAGGDDGGALCAITTLLKACRSSVGARDLGTSQLVSLMTPSHLARHWMAYSLVGVAGVGTTLALARSASLHRILRSTLGAVVASGYSFWKEHVMSPMVLIYRELVQRQYLHVADPQQLVPIPRTPNGGLARWLMCAHSGPVFEPSCGTERC